MENYLDFVQHKSERAVHTDSIAVSVDDLNPNLYSFQRDIVRWALAKGRRRYLCGLRSGQDPDAAGVCAPSLRGSRRDGSDCGPSCRCPANAHGG